MMEKLCNMVGRFSRGRVVLVGDLILDRYVYGDARRISPEAPVPVLHAVERFEQAGGTANVASCLRALGASVRCFGVVGSDASGEVLREKLEAVGVDSSACLVVGDRATTTKTRFVGLAQHRHRQQLLRLDEETAAGLTDADEGRLIDAVAAACSEADVVCVEDYQKGVVSRRLIEQVAAAARGRNVPVIVDPSRRDRFDDYRGVTALTPNRVELESATSLRFGRPQDVIDAAEELLDAFSVDKLVVTLDRDGAVLAGRGSTPIHVPTRPRSVYDNTGAGDAVLSALAAAVAVGANWHEAVMLANVAGGLEVEKFGCVPVTAEQILADLRIEHRRRNGKLKALPDLLAEIEVRRNRGETVVFTNGVFDLLHPGHVAYLAEARASGSMLVVGLNSDASACGLGKGPDRPINDERHRATMLGALEAVDYVVMFDDPTPMELIEQIRPDVLVKGADWGEDGVVGREFVEQHGGQVRLEELVDGQSSTGLIEKIRKRCS